MRRHVPLIAWTLLAAMACGSFAVWWIYTERSRLHEKNRQEIAHASRDLTIALETLQEAVEKGLAEKPAEKFALPLREFATRNPYVYWDRADPEVSLNPNEACRAAKPGFLHPAVIVNPRFVFDGGLLQIDTTPVANFFDVPVSSAAFDYLLIADAHGKVMVQWKHGASGAHHGHLGWVESQAQEQKDAGKGHPLVRVTDLSTLLGVEPQKAQQMLTSASGATRVRIGDSDFHLYYHPIRVPELRVDKQAKSCSTEETTWVIAGLAEPEAIMQEALLISPQWTLLLFLLLVIVVAGQPWAKLVLISPSERFRFADAALLMPSGAVCLLALTLLLGWAAIHLHFSRLAANGLQEMASRVERQLVAELNGLRERTDVFDQAAANRYAASPELACGDVPDHPRLYAPSTVPPEQRWAPATERGRLAPPQVSWIGPDGKQFLKATMFEKAIRFDVWRRPYFREPLAGRLWQLPGGREIFVQTYRSFSTAGSFASLSMRSRLSERCGQGKPVIASISTEPLLIEDPLLPTGYGFAVVNAEGRLVFHSDRRRMLKGDLYEQISDPGNLESLVIARNQGYFRTDYLRGKYQMYVTPLRAIPQAGWYVVTFRDLTVLGTIGNEALVRAAALSVLPLSMPLIAGLGLLFAGKKALRLLWPAEQDAGLYARLALVYIGMFATALLLIAAMRPEPLLPLWLAFPLIPLGTTAALYWHYNKFVRTPGPPLRQTAPYVRAYALLWLLIAVVPALGIYRYSIRIELQKMDGYENERASRHVADWRARDMERVRELRFDNATDRTDYLNTRAAQLAVFRDAALAEAARSIDIRAWVDSRLPVYNEISAAIRYQPPTGRPPRALRSYAGYVAGGDAMRWPGLLGGVGLLGLSALSYLLMRQATGGLFLSDIGTSVQPEDAGQVLAQNDRVLFLVRSENERIRVLRTVWRMKRVEAAAAQTATGGSQTTQGPGGAVVRLGNTTVVPDLEKALLHAGIIDMLEQSWWAGDPIVVVSRALPRDLLPLNADTYVGTRVADPLTTASLVAKDVDAVRWRAVLDHLALSLSGDESGDTSTDAVQQSGLDRGAQPPETANAWFGAMWDYCSREERLTLVQTAEEGVANPHQHETVRRLISKGLLTLRPNLMPMTPGFEHFLRRSALIGQAREWEKAEAGVGWRHSRWIFVIVLVVAGVFIAGTQETLVKAAATVLGTLAALVKAAQEVLGMSSRRASHEGEP